MYSRSDHSLLGPVPDQPPVSVFNPQLLAQQVQLVQAVPVMHPIYPGPGVPVVLSQTRMPVTLLPQAGPPPPPPPAATVAGAQPLAQSSYVSGAAHMQVSSASTASMPDAMQKFLERAEKSGIKLEVLPEPESNVRTQRQTVQSFSVTTHHPVQSAGMQLPSASVSQLSLSISSPEFVPRMRREAATFQYVSNTMPSFSAGNTDPHASLHNSIDSPYNAGDMLAFSGAGHNGDYRNSDATVLAGYYVPQKFANIGTGDRPRPPVSSYVHARFQRRDACSQTADITLVSVGTEGSSVLYVDASTNTPPYDDRPPGGLIQTHDRFEAEPEVHADCRARLNAIYAKATSGGRSPGTDHRLQSGSHSNRWADCWQLGQSTGTGTDEKPAHLLSASKNTTPTSATTSAASRHESSDLHFEESDRSHNLLPKTSVPETSRPSVHGMHSSCDCMISDCPFASPLDVNTNDQSAAYASASNLLPPSHEPGPSAAQKILPKTSSEYETLPGEEDLSEEVYYSDEETNNLLQSGDAGTNTSAGAAAASANSPNPSQSQSTEIHQDHSALLSQLTNGEFPSSATIELAVAQLLEALTADERQLLPQLMQQIGVMNPLLAATSPLILQVEAMRMILTTRGQRALLQLSQPTLQQMALQAQLQNLNLTQYAGVSAPAADPASATVQTKMYPSAAIAAATVTVNHHEDVASLHSHHLSDVSEHRVPLQTASRPSHSVVGASETELKYPDESSSTFSITSSARLEAARGRGIGRGRAQDDESCRQDRPRGRGLRRVRIPASCPAVDGTNASQSDSGSAFARHPPLVPPPQHSAQSVQNPAADSCEDWEEEIDPFSPGMFNVSSSFFKSGKR